MFLVSIISLKTPHTAWRTRCTWSDFEILVTVSDRVPRAPPPSAVLLGAIAAKWEEEGMRQRGDQSPAVININADRKLTRATDDRTGRCQLFKDPGHPIAHSFPLSLSPHPPPSLSVHPSTHPFLPSLSAGAVRCGETSRIYSSVTAWVVATCDGISN